MTKIRLVEDNEMNRDMLSSTAPNGKGLYCCQRMLAEQGHLLANSEKPGHHSDGISFR